MKRDFSLWFRTHREKNKFTVWIENDRKKKASNYEFVESIFFLGFSFWQLIYRSWFENRYKCLAISLLSIDLNRRLLFFSPLKFALIWAELCLEPLPVSEVNLNAGQTGCVAHSFAMHRLAIQLPITRAMIRYMCVDIRLRWKLQIGIWWKRLEQVQAQIFDNFCMTIVTFDLSTGFN